MLALMKKRVRRSESSHPPRVRRTAEDARTAILDATERRLVELGPNGIRLQDVASDVGVSHPTILHHFGNREHLVEAVIQRRVRAMNQEVILALLSARAPDEGSTAIALFDNLYKTLGAGGHARVMAFCALEGRAQSVAPESLKPLAQATHAARLARRSSELPPPSYADTENVVHLAALALFAEAIIGGYLRGDGQSQPNEAGSKHFRDWLAKHLVATLER
jgi:AcrR family transcriptional regulator